MRAPVCHRINRSTSHRFARALLAVCVVMSLATSCRRQPSDPNAASAETPAPPDLSQCTRIEVRVEPSALEALVIPPPNEPNVLSVDEVRWIESLETMVIDDPIHVKALAEDIALAVYQGPRRGGIAILPIYYISGWYEEERLVTFRIKGPVILTEDGHMFRHNRSRRRAVSPTPALDPFRWRLECATNLRWWLGRHFFAKQGESKQAYPPAAQWCDLFMKEREDSEALICPSAGEGKCHYAMNPHCEPNSPEDMVLLFETPAGWNQHGGPELFTFDNHDPRGGCVLLNDGTVKFVCTEKELHALRWK